MTHVESPIALLQRAFLWRGGRESKKVPDSRSQATFFLLGKQARCRPTDVLKTLVGPAATVLLFPIFNCPRHQTTLININTTSSNQPNSTLDNHHIPSSWPLPLGKQMFSGASSKGRQSTNNPNSDICKIIFAVLLPPLGVFLERGCGGDLCINILLTILGVSISSHSSTSVVARANMMSLVHSRHHPRPLHHSQILSHPPHDERWAYTAIR